MGQEDGWGEGESIGIGKGEMEGYQDRPDLTSASSSPSHQDSGAIRGAVKKFPLPFPPLCLQFHPMLYLSRLKP